MNDYDNIVTELEDIKNENKKLQLELKVKDTTLLAEKDKRIDSLEKDKTTINEIMKSINYQQNI